MPSAYMPTVILVPSIIKSTIKTDPFSEGVVLVPIHVVPFVYYRPVPTIFDQQMDHRYRRSGNLFDEYNYLEPLEGLSSSSFFAFFMSGLQ